MTFDKLLYLCNIKMISLIFSPILYYKMETRNEFEFEGKAYNGFLMLFVDIVMLLLSFGVIVYGIICSPLVLVVGCLLLLVNITCWCGFLLLEPNEARVITWFGKYSGTFLMGCFDIAELRKLISP